jgi:hypothetical protein
MKIASARINRFGTLVRTITQARLTHIAILPADHTPAYPGARSKVFRSAWRDDPAELRAPAPEKSGAWMADGGLEAWTGFLLKAVREGGTITVIHRADRLADLLALLTPKAGSFRIRGVQPFSDAPAKRVILQAVKTGKAPLVLLPPLALHDREGGKHTAAAEAILRGQAALDWSGSV